MRIVIVCICTYIGETGRSLKMRINEHLMHTKGPLGKSSIADHKTKIGHDVDFQSASVIHPQPNLIKRKIAEALLIKSHTVVENNSPSFSLSLF